MFKQVDNKWRQNILISKKISNVFEFCNSESLRDHLNEDIFVLDKVQKNLDNYLTLKRAVFSRL